MNSGFNKSFPNYSLEAKFRNISDENKKDVSTMMIWAIKTLNKN